ncbi:hypothetical protein D9613_008783 [Agrocybe pediades]|uniref:Uncharacterized protein n=1 Tax=Agrocybe pediades TaxID=84607 RepID=A0A8H4VQ56_9AGAR|nr:hypothetical protein D9613_008783 [Agrocybe pediades]
MENDILSLLQSDPVPPSHFQVNLSNFQVIGLGSSGRSITIAVDAVIINQGKHDVSEYDGEVTVRRARLTIANMEKRKSMDLPRFQVEFEPPNPNDVNKDVQSLLQALILKKEPVKIKLVFPNPFHGDDRSEPALSIVESEICGNGYDLIKRVHVYIGIKVLTSKTLSFQFHFSNPFPVDLAICYFDIIAGKDEKAIAQATSDKVFRLRPMNDRVSERANDARLCAGYIDAGRFLVGGSSSKLSIDLDIKRAKILVGDFEMDGLTFKFPDVPLTYGKPGTKFKKQKQKESADGFEEKKA